MSWALPEPRPFRLGVAVNQMPSRPELEEMARKAESIGYSTFLFFGDHRSDRNAIAPSALVAADCTSRRNPVLLVAVGTVDQVVEDLLGWREQLGINDDVVVPAHLERLAPVAERPAAL